MSSSVEIIVVPTNKVSIAIDFLLPYERTCVSLMGRLLKANEILDQTIFAVVDKNTEFCLKSIKGIFIVSFMGIILHHILPCNCIQELRTLLHKQKIFSIGGVEQSSTLFEEAIRKKPRTKNHYHLMSLDTKNYLRLNKKLGSKYETYKCNLDDVEKLFFLQMNYQIEEVLPPGKTITDNNCKSIIHERLKNHTVFAINNTETNELVCMAGTNANGINYTQLGGIFTHSMYRNKGLAQYLISMLISHQKNKICLFVKKENKPAIAAYSKIGFKTVDSYTILYM